MEELAPNNRFNPITPFVMVFARRLRKNHANPSLRSGQALRVKPMLELFNVILLEKGREAVRLSLILAFYVPIKNDEEKKIKKLKRREERSALWGENSNNRFNLINPIVTILAKQRRVKGLFRVWQESRQCLATLGRV